MNEADLNEKDAYGADDQEIMSMWCEECGVSNIGECLIHGGNITRTHDNTPPPKAWLSLPKILAIKRAKKFDISCLEARKGVFAKKAVKIRTLFGPMEAVVTEKKPRLPLGAIEYQVHGKDGEPLYLETLDKFSCNWMIFVRPANKFSQQNLAAFENNGQIFFVTCKNIPAGTELRVWYAAAYAKAIGKSCLMPKSSDKVSMQTREKRSNQNQTNEANLNKDNTESAEVGNTSQDHTSLAKDKILEVIPVKDFLQQNPLLNPDTMIRSDNNMYTCNQCSMSFARPRQLESHVCHLFRQSDDSLESLPRRRKGRPKKCPTSTELSQPSYTDNSVVSAEGNSEDLISPKDIKQESLKFPESLDDQTAHPDLSTDGTHTDDDIKKKRRPGRPRKNKSLPKKPNKRNCQQANFNCDSCGAVFASKTQFLQHNCNVTYVCKHENCSKIFTSKFRYQRHKIIHEKPNNFECNICPSKFNRLDHLRNHMLVHDSNRDTFVCSTCGKSYLYKSTLMFHMARHEADEGNSLVCLVCDQRFPTKEELKKHVNIHNRYKREDKPRQVSCPQCGKQFLSQKDIRRHMVTHTKERSFLCEHCPHTFVRKDHLRRHYAVSHKKEHFELQMKSSPYGCYTCFQAFRKQAFLDYHNKTVHPAGVVGEEQKSLNMKPAKNVGKNECVLTSQDGKAAPPGSLGKHLLLLKQKAAGQQKVVSQLENFPVQSLIQSQSQLSEPIAPSEIQSLLPEPYPVNVIKIHQPGDQGVVTSGQSTSLFYSTFQTSASNSNIFEALGEEVLTAGSKTAQFGLHNQVLSQAQLQAPSSTHLQLDNQQQQRQEQMPQAEQSMMQPKSSQQQHLIHQQYSSSTNLCSPVQMQVQQLLLPQQFTVHQQQPSQPMGQIINLADLQGASNTNILITIDNQNFVSLQGVNLGKPGPQILIKDGALSSKQVMQTIIPPPQQQESPLKLDNNFLIRCNGQIYRAPQDNSALAQLLNTCCQVQELKQGQVMDDEASHVIGQLGNNFITGPNLVKPLSQGLHIQNDVIINQQPLQDHAVDPLQSQLQGQLLQQQVQGHVLQQGQILDKGDHQELPNYAVTWFDNLDFKAIGEMCISGDPASTSLDNHGGCWILQQQMPTLEQQQIQHLQVQGQQMQNSPVFSLPTSCSLTD